MAQDNQTAGSNITQTTFIETPYEDATWEVVGEVVDNSEFMPMEIEAIAAPDAKIVDPMFADYGGFPGGGEKKRWHLPEHLSGAMRAEEEAEAEDTEERTALTDQEIAAIKAEAFELGRAQGLEEANKVNEKRALEIEKRLMSVLNDMITQIRENVTAIERNSVDFALAVSKKIVGFAVEINPEYIIPIVNDALGLAGGATIRKVRVSPEDMEFIEVVGVAKNLKSFDGTWHFEKDASIRSGCVVETSAGQVDFQLDAAWERIKENVVKSLA